jgi:hypothetical protein
MARPFAMRLILSRKGFDSGAGGCPSPIFPDASMVALPIPQEASPIRYRDLVWRGRNLGELVEALTKGRQRADNGAHLDPDLRPELLPRAAGWRGSLGQIGVAQGHLRNQGVRAGDLFVFWGVYRRVDSNLRWWGRPEHYVWGWLQVESVASVDDDVRTDLPQWGWLGRHPHLVKRQDPTNTLYVAKERLELPGWMSGLPGYGVFEFATAGRRLTAEGADGPLEWSLPRCFLPNGRPALTYHAKRERWIEGQDGLVLRAAARGQEFVLGLDFYPEVVEWIRGLFRDRHP